MTFFIVQIELTLKTLLFESFSCFIRFIDFYKMKDVIHTSCRRSRKLKKMICYLHNSVFEADQFFELICLIDSSETSNITLCTYLSSVHLTKYLFHDKYISKYIEKLYLDYPYICLIAKCIFLFIYPVEITISGIFCFAKGYIIMFRIRKIPWN